jgi:hypothetical protein
LDGSDAETSSDSPSPSFDVPARSFAAAGFPVVVGSGG